MPLLNTSGYPNNFFQISLIVYFIQWDYVNNWWIALYWKSRSRIDQFCSRLFLYKYAYIIVFLRKLTASLSCYSVESFLHVMCVSHSQSVHAGLWEVFISPGTLFNLILDLATNVHKGSSEDCIYRCSSFSGSELLPGCEGMGSLRSLISSSMLGNFEQTGKPCGFHGIIQALEWTGFRR